MAAEREGTGGRLVSGVQVDAVCSVDCGRKRVKREEGERGGRRRNRINKPQYVLTV